jgi:RNA polymerase sigma-70 factor (ECF subfamily)
MCANVRSDLKSDDTVELLRRARAGEHDALERLFDHHVPILRRWASGRMPRWARNADDTWDVVQETVIQTLKHLDTFEPRGVGALQAYLRRAVINRIRNAIRRATIRPQASELPVDIANNDTSALDTVIRQQAKERYDAGLASLEPLERDALLGRIELGLSYSALAQALGKPSPDAARMTVARAMMKLSKAMNRDQPLTPPPPADARTVRRPR